MDFAAMNREQIALLVALVGVFCVIPIGWLIHGVLNDKRDAALLSKTDPTIEHIIIAEPAPRTTDNTE